MFIPLEPLYAKLAQTRGWNALSGYSFFTTLHVNRVIQDLEWRAPAFQINSGKPYTLTPTGLGYQLCCRFLYFGCARLEDWNQGSLDVQGWSRESKEQWFKSGGGGKS